MANLTKGTPPQPYGQGGRKVILPMKQAKQVYEGGMVAQVSGACVAATDSGETGGVIGVAECDMLGGASDGATRLPVWTEKEFIFNNDVSNPCSDATPYGAVVYATDDHTIGTSSAGSSLPVGGRFCGLEDDGRVRVYISWISCCSGTP